MRRFRWTSLAVAVMVAAVLVTPGSAQEVEIKPAAKVKKDKYLITADEIAARPDLSNAYDAVRLLRPAFLKPTRAKGGMAAGSSAGTSPDPYNPDGSVPGGSPGAGGYYGGAGTLLMPVLYFDDVKQDGVEQLKNVLVSEIVEIRYVGGNEAAGRYGAGHEGGVILLKTKRFGKG